MTPTQLIYRAWKNTPRPIIYRTHDAKGNDLEVECEFADPEEHPAYNVDWRGECTVCGAESAGGIPNGKMFSGNYADWDKHRNPQGDHVCAACAYTMLLNTASHRCGLLRYAAEKFKDDPSKFGGYAFVAISRALVRETHRSRPQSADIDMIPVASPDPYAELYDRMDRERIAGVCRRYMTPVERAAVQRIIEGEKAKGGQQGSAKERAIKKCRRHLKAMTSALPKPTCTCAAQTYGVDRSTILRHSQSQKMGKVWQIEKVELPERPARYSKPYTGAERKLLLSALTDEAAAQQIGRSPNAVHIARWRMRKARALN